MNTKEIPDEKTDQDIEKLQRLVTHVEFKKNLFQIEFLQGNKNFLVSFDNVENEEFFGVIKKIREASVDVLYENQHILHYFTNIHSLQKDRTQSRCFWEDQIMHFLWVKHAIVYFDQRNEFYPERSMALQNVLNLYTFMYISDEMNYHQEYANDWIPYSLEIWSEYLFYSTNMTNCFINSMGDEIMLDEIINGIHFYYGEKKRYDVDKILYLSSFYNLLLMDMLRDMFLEIKRKETTV
jgi:hypothetical protein